MNRVHRPYSHLHPYSHKIPLVAAVRCPHLLTHFILHILGMGAWVPAQELASCLTPPVLLTLHPQGSLLGFLFGFVLKNVLLPSSMRTFLHLLSPLWNIWSHHPAKSDPFFLPYLSTPSSRRPFLMHHLDSCKISQLPPFSLTTRGCACNQCTNFCFVLFKIYLSS